MDIFTKLSELGLNSNNSVIIGSGILSALHIRSSNDIDVVVDPDTYLRLRQLKRFKIKNSYGREILADNLFEIGTSWGVLDKDQILDDLTKNSVVIDGTRYITLEFLLAVKQSWLNGDNIRQKDIDDVELIQEYLQV